MRESPFDLEQFPKLTMNRLNGIGHIADAANISQIFKLLIEPLPIVTPEFDDKGLFAIPMLLKLHEYCDLYGNARFSRYE